METPPVSFLESLTVLSTGAVSKYIMTYQKRKQIKEPITQFKVNTLKAIDNIVMGGNYYCKGNLFPNTFILIVDYL